MARTVETEVLDVDDAVRSREASEPSDSEKKSPSKRVSRWILIAFAAVALAGASMWWLHSQNYETTDDAQIEGHLDLVSTRISGTVTYINPLVEDTHFVEAGKIGEILTSKPRVVRATRSLIFVSAEVTVDKRCIAMASGVFKILKSE